MLLAVAEFERGLIKERVTAGIRAAQERGVRFGRPATLDQHRDDVLKLKRKGLGVRAIARKLALPVSSVHKIVKKQ